MPHDPLLEQRVRRFLDARGIEHEAKRMMGGLCFMVNGKMCVGIEKNRLMARIDPEAEAHALTKPGCKPMDFTGRPMRGFVFIEPLGTRNDAQLADWLNLALEFNPKARASQKRK